MTKTRTRLRSPEPLKIEQIITPRVALPVTSGLEAPNDLVGTGFVAGPLEEVVHLPCYPYLQSPQHLLEICQPDVASEVGGEVAGRIHVSCRPQFEIRPYIASLSELPRFALLFLESDVTPISCITTDVVQDIEPKCVVNSKRMVIASRRRVGRCVTKSRKV